MMYILHKYHFVLIVLLRTWIMIHHSFMLVTSHLLSLFKDV
jgi:hypothetical protein